MGVIWTSKTRQSQPQGIARIDWKSPFAKGVRAVFDLNSGCELVSGAFPTTRLGSSGVSRTGKGALFDTSSYYVYAHRPAFALTGDLAIVALVDIGSLNNYSSIVTKQTSSTTHSPFEYRLGGSGSSGSEMQLLRATAGSYAQMNAVGSLSAGTSQLVGIQHSASSGKMRAFYNGTAEYEATRDVFTPTDNGADLYVASRPDTVTKFNGTMFYVVLYDRLVEFQEWRELKKYPWALFAPEKRPLFFSTGGGANNTGTLAVTLDAATLTGVGGVARSGTLATTLDAAALTGVGNVTRSGTLAVTLDAATLAGTGAVTRSGTLSSTLDAVTLAGVGSVAVGTNRDGVLAVTLDSATLAGTGAVTRSGTLAVTLDAATLAGVGTAGQAITGTLGVTLGNVTLAGIGAIPAAPSAGGGKTFGSNKKKKKQRKAIESEEWLKAEETAKQLLQDRFTKTTPEAKLEALASHIESLQPVIEALKALAREDVQEAVQETRTEELTEHQLVLNRFDALEKKIESVEELLIILMADL